MLTEHPAPLARRANAEFDAGLPPNAFVDSSAADVHPTVVSWAYGFFGPAADLEPAPGAVVAMHELVDWLGPENVNIVTARPGTFECRMMTELWLSDWDFPHVATFFTPYKVDVAREVGASHAIDDAPRHVDRYVAAGLKCYYVGWQRPWHLHSSVIAVPTFVEACRALRLEDRWAERRERRVSNA